MIFCLVDHHHGDQPEVHRGGEQGDRAAERLAAARAGQPQPVAHQQLSKHPASTYGKNTGPLQIQTEANGLLRLIFSQSNM